MTVDELIYRLQKLPGHLDVEVHDAMGRMVSSANVAKVTMRNGKGETVRIT